MFRRAEVYLPIARGGRASLLGGTSVRLKSLSADEGRRAYHKQEKGSHGLVKIFMVGQDMTTYFQEPSLHVNYLYTKN